MNFIDLGFSNYVDSSKIIFVSQVDSAPIKRMIKNAKEENRFIDVTQGRKARSIIYSACGDEIVLTQVTVLPSTIVSRMKKVNPAFENLLMKSEVENELEI